ncbi:MAG: accessory Sec system protein Asp2 [Absicoccus sp.]|uniref:accessory Sec system protein Asp2 n=1 Tax=Absicoccus TaxID=2718525 RepID=UPI002A75D261|nr:accessory Sec system protein Asp2 [Absicoccus sp.]MDY3036597.1 accessory Sec system protein Asp2 [Absicoccus sp.]
MNIRALQLGNIDYSRQFTLSPDIEWNYEPTLDMTDAEYDIAIIDRQLNDQEANILARIVRAYSLFVLDDVLLSDRMVYMMQSRCGQKIARNELPSFLEKQILNYFGRPYGEKFDPHTVAITPGFQGRVYWNGFTEIVMEGNFGSQMKQALYWRGNIPVEAGQAIDFWLEYETSGDIEIELQIVQFVSGSVASIQKIWTFDEKTLRHPVTIENKKQDGPVFISLHAKGKGKLHLIALHDRYSRRGAGSFLPGSQRIVTNDREEIFAYLDPGDLKPPLCVYFSGYKTMEGFEGYHMMRRMGTPFLLISEARLEGGSFYLGNEEFENCLKDVIEKAMQALGFTHDQVVLSGLSMGTFGALYYGTMLRPGYIIVGKPLVNLGSMAKAERIERPGGFPTSLDVLWKQYHHLDQKAIDQMNQHFWEKFDQADWTGRAFYVAYMIEDDYDAHAYAKLISHMQGRGARIIGKGLHGRHNDDTSGIVHWFLRQYRRILRDGFGRK